jgi:hypothetical protein
VLQRYGTEVFRIQQALKGAGLFTFGMLAVAAVFSNNFSLFLVYSWMLPYLEQRFQMEPGKAGLFSGMPMYCGVVATSAGGLAVDFLLRRGYGGWSRAIPAIAGFTLASAGESLAGAATTLGWFVIWLLTGSISISITKPFAALLTIPYEVMRTNCCTFCVGGRVFIIPT